MAGLNKFLQMDTDDIIASDRLRSSIVKTIISELREETGGDSEIPRTIVQFWDSSETPDDVQECLESWRPLDYLGLTRHMFDSSSARAFISEHFDKSHAQAFKHCTHPAMQADYFRLCFIYKYGGVYIDADDEYAGGNIEVCLRGHRLKLNPLCYRISTDAMEDPFSQSDDNNDLVFYVNNNPLAAPPYHPLIKLALDQATDRLLNSGQSRDIQAITGPGNLTEILVRHALELTKSRKPLDFEILRNWDTVAISKWPLDYRQSNRNWRHWIKKGSEL